MEKLLVIVTLPVTITIVTEETLQRVCGAQSQEYSDRAVRTAVTYLMSYSWRRHDFLFFVFPSAVLLLRQPLHTSCLK